MAQSASLWHCPMIVGGPSYVTLPNQGIKLELIALIVTKRTILLNWKSRTKLNILIWIDLLTELITVETVTAWISHKIPQFHRA